MHNVRQQSKDHIHYYKPQGEWVLDTGTVVDTFQGWVIRELNYRFVRNLNAATLNNSKVIK